MFAAAPSDWALLVTAVGGVLAVLTTSVVTIINALAQAQRDHILHAEVVGVHDELRTLNGLTVGEKSDQDESRRIDKIPKAEQTPAEQAHVEAVPPPTPPVG